jgi:ROS/MUCR transcriptional regulator protein
MFGEMGVIATDATGDHIQCHECGEWFVSVAHHAYMAHQITAKEYREMFGLNDKQGLISPEFSRRKRPYGVKLYKDYGHLSPVIKGTVTRGSRKPMSIQGKKNWIASGAPIKAVSAMSAAVRGSKRPEVAQRNRDRAIRVPQAAVCPVCNSSFEFLPYCPRVTCGDPQCISELKRRRLKGKKTLNPWGRAGKPKPERGHERDATANT